MCAIQKKYDCKFKLEIPQGLFGKKVNTKRMSEEYNISRSTTTRWVSEYLRYEENDFAGKGKRLLGKVDFYILNRKING
ncbi:hypothetical protein QuyetLC_24610 [Bacillus anthracis]|uniref:Transposase n=1 Tax=Bacillus anthracis TaxID=1392 RepID=A0A640MHF8_BACAN|nr:hypothetical protein QuyetLC_24610 [Bacillus anthracis]